MIYTDENCILPGTLELLKNLQNDPYLDHFCLVGGTALALQIGHRLSIDLDLFTRNPIDTQDLTNHLTKNYDFFADFVAPNTLKGFINGIKTDFITHDYLVINPLVTHDTLRIISMEDIGAMKLNAIAHQGNRQKDFYDMYFLLSHFSLRFLLNAYELKYPMSNTVIPLKALVYFQDIDFDIEYPILTKHVTFEKVKERLIKATIFPNKVFS